MDSIRKLLSDSTTSINDTKLNSVTVQRTWYQYFQTKNFFILLLLSIIILLFLGINIFVLFGYIFQSIVYALKPVISSILLLFGVSINTIGDLFDGIGDAIDSVLHIFGDGIQSISKYSLNNNEKNWNNNIYSNRHNIMPNDTNSNIQQSNNSYKKQSWCLIGNTPGSKTCIPVSDSTKCMSGMVYDNEQMCINPVTTNNNPMSKTINGNGNNIYYPNASRSNISPFINMPYDNVKPITSLPDGSMSSKSAKVENIKTTVPTTLLTS